MVFNAKITQRKKNSLKNVAKCDSRFKKMVRKAFFDTIFRTNAPPHSKQSCMERGLSWRERLDSSDWQRLTFEFVNVYMYLVCEVNFSEGEEEEVTDNSLYTFSIVHIKNVLLFPLGVLMFQARTDQDGSSGRGQCVGGSGFSNLCYSGQVVW